MKKEDKHTAELTRVAEQFRAYFDAYYTEHREVKSLALREMKDGAGIYAVLDYGSFVQYVNYYRKEYGAQAINACFELTHESYRFLCHFDDILDELNSSDISFYTYPKCITAERIESALNQLMAATQRYFDDIAAIVASPERCASVFSEVFGWELEDEPELEDFEPPVVPEDASDFNAFLYYVLDSDLVAMKKELTRKHRKNKLETRFEKRAYDALADADIADLRTEKRKTERAGKYPLALRIRSVLPYALAAVIAAPLFFVLGNKVDSAVFSGCIGRDSSDTAFAFALIGICVAEILCLPLHRQLARLFGGKYKEEAQTMDSTEMTKGSVILLVLLFLAASCALFYFEFTGVAFKNGHIVYKPNGITALQEYAFDDTNIVRIDNGDGSVEEYAFCFDGDWVEYYALEEPEKELLREKLANREIKTYESVEDIENEDTGN